jgi:hypothetical protein
VPATAVLAPLGAGSEPDPGLAQSRLLAFILAAAAAFAVFSMALAAIPVTALDRLAGSEGHLSTAQLAYFIRGHRVDVAVAGLCVAATLLVAAIVATFLTLPG